MDLKITKTDLKDILPLRESFLKENNVQIRYDACHARGWSDSYLINIEGNNVGYGSVKGKEGIGANYLWLPYYI